LPIGWLGCDKNDKLIYVSGIDRTARSPWPNF
jgi:hypothetical protein